MAKTTASASSGDWSGEIWTNGVPDPTVDTWTITAGHEVNIDIDIADLSGLFTISGTLKIDTGMAGRTVGVVPVGMVITENDGVITTNNGTVVNNVVQIGTNAGTVSNNSGTVLTNQGAITVNDAYVFCNRGTVATNNAYIGASFGVVTTNSGSVFVDLTTCIAGNIKDAVTIGGVLGEYDPITGNYTDPGKANVKTGSDYTFAGVAQTAAYPTTEASKAEQLAADFAKIDTPAASKIEIGTTAHAIDAAGDQTTVDGSHPTSATDQATGAAAQLVTDQAAVLAAAGWIISGHSILSQAGAFDLSVYVLKTDVVASGSVALSVPRWTGATGEGYVGTAVLTQAGVQSALDAQGYTEARAAYIDGVDTIAAKLPSKSYLAGTDNASGAVEASAMTGNFPGSVDSVVDPVTTTVAPATAEAIADAVLDEAKGTHTGLITLLATQATATAIKAKTDLIADDTPIIVSSWVAQSGERTVYRGASYATATASAITASDTGTTWPVLTGVGTTVELRFLPIISGIASSPATLVVTGTVTGARAIQFELDAEDTLTLAPGVRRYVAEAWAALGTGEAVPLTEWHVTVKEGREATNAL